MRAVTVLCLLACAFAIAEGRNTVADKLVQKRAAQFGSGSLALSQGSLGSLGSSLGSSIGSSSGSVSFGSSSSFSIPDSVASGSSSNVLQPGSSSGGLVKAVVINPNLTPTLMDEVKKINEILSNEPGSATEDKSADLNAQDDSDEAKEARKQAMDDEALMGEDSCGKLPSEESGCSEESSEDHHDSESSHHESSHHESSHHESSHEESSHEESGEESSHEESSHESGSSHHESGSSHSSHSSSSHSSSSHSSESSSSHH